MRANFQWHYWAKHMTKWTFSSWIATACWKRPYRSFVLMLEYSREADDPESRKKLQKVRKIRERLVRQGKAW